MGVFDDRFGALYHPHVGRPGIPIRLMVGLSYLQRAFALSDEGMVKRWVENPYWQYFCGFNYLQLALPIDPSSLVRWRQRISQDGIELLLQETIAAAQRAEAIKAQSLERVSLRPNISCRASGSTRSSISNNAAERALRRLALGRKSWLFCGSDRAGERAAVIYSLIRHPQAQRHRPAGLAR